MSPTRSGRTRIRPGRSTRRRSSSTPAASSPSASWPARDWRSAPSTCRSRPRRGRTSATSTGCRSTTCARSTPSSPSWDLTPVDVIDNGELLEHDRRGLAGLHRRQPLPRALRGPDPHDRDPPGQIEAGRRPLLRGPGQALHLRLPAPADPARPHGRRPRAGPGALARRALRRVDAPGDRRRGARRAPRRTRSRSGPRRARELEADAYSIHMHVWTQAEFLKLILHCRERFEDAFDIEAAARQGIEFIVVLRKAGRRRRPGAGPPGRAPLAAAPRRIVSKLRRRSRRLASSAAFRLLFAGARARRLRICDPHRPLAARPCRATPLAIQVEGLKKAFRIPTHRVDSLKERAVHPFAAREYRELQALDGVSFEIRQGEFFGIVGRNGSGKSTLLKLLASIYRADAGTIRIAGRLAPFIELGVGFNPELTARENVVLNGVMMGLTPERGARPPRRGDRVRRARGVRRPEAEELLVGDAGAAGLLGDAPGRRRRAADRRGAGGRRRRLPAEVRRRLPRDESRRQDDRPRHPRDGDGRGLLPPGDADRRRQDRGHRRARRGRARSTCGSTSPRTRRRPATRPPATSTTADGVRLLDAWLEDEAASARQRRARRADPDPSRDRSCAEESPGLGVGFVIVNADGRRRSSIRHAAIAGDGAGDRLEAGERVRVERRARRTRSPRAATSSTAACSAPARRRASRSTLHNALDFVVFGGRRPRRGLAAARDRDAVARGEASGDELERRRDAPSCARSGARRRSAAAGGASSTCSG